MSLRGTYEAMARDAVARLAEFNELTAGLPDLEEFANGTVLLARVRYGVDTRFFTTAFLLVESNRSDGFGRSTTKRRWWHTGTSRVPAYRDDELLNWLIAPDKELLELSVVSEWQVLLGGDVENAEDSP